MSETKPKGISTSLAVLAVIAAVIIGAVGGYFIKPAPTAVTETVAKTETVARTQTVTKTVAEKETVEKKYTIYVVVHGGIAHPAWKANKAGVDAAAAILPEVDVKYVGPEVYDLEEFLSFIETAIAAEPDALTCTMTAPEAMEPMLIGYARKGGVITEINTGEAAPESIRTLTYVGYKPYETGGLAAKKMAEMAKERGVTIKQTVYANHHPGAVHIEEWGRGFIDACKDMGIKSESLDVTADEYKGAEILLAYAKVNPDLGFIYFPSIAHCEAALPRLEEEGLHIAMGTFDFTTKMMDYIKEGKVWYTQDQQMYLQGFYGVMCPYLYLKYKFVTPRMITTLGFVTPETAEEFKHYAEIGIR